MNSIIKTLQYKYALSENGAKDMVRAFAACTFSDLVLMIPAGLLYQFIDTVYTADAPISGSQILFFGIGILVCLALICLSTVFTKQHSVIDVACGLAVAFVWLPVVYRPARALH